MQSRYSSLMFEKLATRREALLETLARGLEHDAYWLTVGQIRGIDEAMSLSNECDLELGMSNARHLS